MLNSKVPLLGACQAYAASRPKSLQLPLPVSTSCSSMNSPEKSLVPSAELGATFFGHGFALQPTRP